MLLGLRIGESAGCFHLIAWLQSPSSLFGGVDTTTADAGLEKTNAGITDIYDTNDLRENFIGVELSSIVRKIALDLPVVIVKLKRGVCRCRLALHSILLIEICFNTS